MRHGPVHRRHCRLPSLHGRTPGACTNSFVSPTMMPSRRAIAPRSSAAEFGCDGLAALPRHIARMHVNAHRHTDFRQCRPPTEGSFSPAARAIRFRWSQPFRPAHALPQPLQPAVAEQPAAGGTNAVACPEPEHGRRGCHRLHGRSAHALDPGSEIQSVRAGMDG